ncbi:hypothetical protein LEP1GSC112_0663 [Leptospira interrogans serovar Pomona str. UT364]|nr:hypothetical protein LEP1GSC112_0663 [Leptospira interrogans serovar Pomona str. UT364]
MSKNLTFDVQDSLYKIYFFYKKQNVGTTTNLDFTVKVTKTPRFLERKILGRKNKCKNSYFLKNFP